MRPWRGRSVVVPCLSGTTVDRSCYANQCSPWFASSTRLSSRWLQSSEGQRRRAQRVDGGTPTHARWAASAWHESAPFVAAADPPPVEIRGTRLSHPRARKGRPLNPAERKERPLTSTTLQMPLARHARTLSGRAAAVRLRVDWCLHAVQSARDPDCQTAYRGLDSGARLKRSPTPPSRRDRWSGWRRACSRSWCCPPARGGACSA